MFIFVNKDDKLLNLSNVLIDAYKVLGLLVSYFCSQGLKINPYSGKVVLKTRSNNSHVFVSESYFRSLLKYFRFM